VGSKYDGRHFRFGVVALLLCLVAASPKGGASDVQHQVLRPPELIEAVVSASLLLGVECDHGGRSR
jgi:hypothetical protein